MSVSDVSRGVAATSRPSPWLYSEEQSTSVRSVNLGMVACMGSQAADACACIGVVPD